MPDNTQLNKNSSGGDIIATDDIGGVKHQRVKIQHGVDGSATDVSVASPLPVNDYWMQHAINNILADYGDTVSVYSKNKDLLKFGRNSLVGTSQATIMTLPAGVLNETYVASNLINTVSSSSASDTYVLTVEGHTVSGGVFTFVTQDVTLKGQTQVALTPPLARGSRSYNGGAVDSVGNIYVYETDTDTAGVPDTAAKVHLIQVAGLNNSEKASTTISNTDYLILTSFYADCLEKTAAFVDIHLEVREVGKVFRDKVTISANTGARGEHIFMPYLVIPKNADIRLSAIADGASTVVAGGFQGVLAKVI